ncbi:MAG: N-6 DNA methylase [Desulfamplus sp.]|nr:N-6 DNA methylase [Desulfamplus sp.]
MPINQYLKQVKQRFAAGISTEHSYRSDLQVLLSNLVKGITVTNEPKRQKCGAPDYIIQNKEVPLGYIEAKDIGIDLNKTERTDQMKRYLASLDNLILTDYLQFRFYKYGSKVSEIKIASIENGKLVVCPEQFPSFETHIKDFCGFTGQTIKSAEKLAKMMAQKAKMMEEVLFNAVKNEDSEDNSLKDQLEAFRQILINDLDEKTFADIYAQTIAYGLFAARLHDKTLEDFSRQEARELIPRSNPFLRNLFDYVSGAQLDERVVWIVNDLCEIFRATDLQSILSDFGKATGQNDPFLHFYETFLTEYDPKLRKSRGVYYTPEPVVNFIVRAVDDILKEEFGLSKGLADTSKVKIKRKIEGTATKKGKDVYKEEEIHKVQILDPATGTGTFLAETVKQIYSKFKGQEGLWSSYVEKDLIPRINGFEILMASYTMCHLKLEMLLNETGYKPKNDNQQPRLKVYLTNSLEEVNPYTGTLFASWLSRESTEANYVKRDAPVMVVIGNPPYSGESANKGKWIMNLMEDYKKEPGGNEKLKERNPKWINDDYVKFIRYGQFFIEKNGSGVLAFINPHGFLDNPTFRGMRWNLLKTFDKIYTIDLHGNAKKKEFAPDGSIDQNVFDIMQGVSINLFVKTDKKKNNELGKVFHCDLFGKREVKYNFLFENSIKSVLYKELPNIAPNYFLVSKDFDLQEIYDKGIRLEELFTSNNVGIVTARDNFTIHNSKIELQKTIEEFLTLDDETARVRFHLGKDVRDWQVNFAKKDLQKNYPNKGAVVNINYRPFDVRWTFYTGNSKGFHCYPRTEIMKHFIKGNVGIVYKLGNSEEQSASAMVTNTIIDFRSWSRPGMQGGDYVAPLYLYPDASGQQTIDQAIQRTPNLNLEIIKQISKKLSLAFTPEKETTENTFAPIDILDYVYAVLHSPTYREKYKEFLKIDFPRVPYPENKEIFWQLVKLGGELRTIHLLENPIVEEYITTYPIDGTNIVEKPQYLDGKVYINKEQYFDKMPEIAWNFYIGGYQPAQKWLKDRKGRELSVDDILHYQKIIVALSETYRIMLIIRDLEL